MKKQFNKIQIFLASAFLLGSVFYAGYSHGHNTFRDNISGQVYAKTLSDKADLSLFWEVWGLLEEKYSSTEADTHINNQEKVWGAIKGLVDSYDDPYTEFFTPEENESFESSVEGNFSGLGIEIGIQDDILTVISPLKGSPAEGAGIRAGDKIIQIDGQSTSGISLDEAVSQLRGKQGTSVSLLIYREGEEEPKTISVVRDIIQIKSIETQITEEGVFVISVYTFSSDVNRSFRLALKEFIKSKKDKLIIDLRGNPGGYLDGAIDMASWFVPAGKTIVTERFSNNTEDKIFRSRGYAQLGDIVDIVVLVDEGSASASEIFAGALQEYGIATIVGQKTYGKGSVQELVPLDDGSSLKVTIAQWLTPKGASISSDGLNPDIVVENIVEDSKLKDLQLQKAIEILNK